MPAAGVLPPGGYGKKMKKVAYIYNSRHSVELKSFLAQEPPGVETTLIELNDLFSHIKKFVFGCFRRFDRVVLVSYDLATQPMLFFLVCLVLWLAGGKAYLTDLQGRWERVSFCSLLFKYLPAFLRELVLVPYFIRQAKKDLAGINGDCAPAAQNRIARLPGGTKIAYLRTDHWFGISAGGSVAHTAGVAGGFLGLGCRLFFISTDRLPWLAETGMPVYLVKPDGVVRSLPELPELAYNRRLIKAGREILAQERPGLLYQRYSLNNYAGLYLAMECNLPFVLEYNGSFPWMARHWGRPLWFAKTAAAVESRVCRLSDLVVVVSAPMKEELARRGVEEDRILVNPNGVDPGRYSPLVDGSGVRGRYGLAGKTVVGFTGTFGKWHGADKLAEAAALLLSRPEGRERLRFLFIGDGPLLPEVKAAVSSFAENCIFTGMVPQEEGPRHLAACDVLVAPHLPNPDGTPFFGSPTKLFEYMAMGKGIVASRLGQMGEILAERRTALLVEPGNAAALAEGIWRLAADRCLRLALGENARREALAKYTWEKHAGRILAALRDRGRFSVTQ